MTLTEFVLARIAEDEAVARGWADDVDGVAPDGRPWRDPSGHFIWQPKARFLADCDAHRRIVETCAEAWEQRRPNGTPTEWGHHVWGGLEYACRALALSYADHPDYREEWKP